MSEPSRLPSGPRIAVVGRGSRARAAAAALARALPGCAVTLLERPERERFAACDVAVAVGAAVARRVRAAAPELPLVAWTEEDVAPPPAEEPTLGYQGAAEGLAGAVTRVLAEALRRVRGCLDRLPVGVFRTTAEGRLVSASRRALELLGLEGVTDPRARDVAALYADPEERRRHLECLEHRQVLRGEEILVRRPDGAEVWVRESSRAVRDAAGRLVALEGILEEVTGERRLREVIERGKRAWEATFDVVPDLIVMYGEEGRIERLNRAMAAVLGGEPAELVGRELPEPWRAAAARAAGRERVIGPDEGLPGHYLVSVGGIPDADGGALRVAVFRDVSELERLRREALRGEAMFRTLAESNLAGVYLIRGDRFAYVNPAMARIVGHDPEHIVERMRVEDVVWPEDRELVRENIRRRLAGDVEELRYRFRLLHRDGHPVPVEVLGRRVELEGEAVILGTLMDVSARVEAERRLRERTRELETLLANLPGMAYRCANDPDWTMAFVSEGARELTGYEPEELVGPGAVPFARLIHPEDRERVWQEVQRALESRRPYRLQYRLVARDGTVRWVWERGRGVWAEDGSLGHLEGIVLDVSDRIAAEERSRAAFRRLETLVEQLPEAVLLLDGSGELLLANRVATSLVEAGAVGSGPDGSVTEVLGVPLAELGREPVEVERDGRSYALAARRVRGTSRGELLVVVRDITRERDAARRLARQERLAAVGRLAAGIAHDFNNLLQSVMTSAELILMASPDDPVVRRHAETVRSQAERGGRLVRQILDFSRKSLRRPEPLELAALVRDTVELLRASVREDVAIDVRVQPGEHWIVGDPVQIQQALTNLVLNGAAAMADGGVLRVELAAVDVGEGQPPPAEGVTPGRWETIAVADTGVGIPEEIRERIFEPFFTTRGDGGGTGLGLAQVWGIVQQHRGAIHVSSRVGVGSIFTIYLPAASRPAEPVREGEASAGEEVGRGELVLLAEDEASVRESTATALRRHGFEVATAADGLAALEAFERLRDEVAAVVTDAVMPRLGGVELARRLRAAGFTGPVAVLSGYPLGEEREGAEAPVDRWLSKPVAAGELAAVLRDLLGR